VDAKESGKLTGRAELTLDLMSVKVTGRMVDINTQERFARRAIRAASARPKWPAGAVLGAIIGGIAGGGKGAVIGAGAGGAAGAGVEEVTKGPAGEGSVGDPLDFRFGHCDSHMTGSLPREPKPNSIVTGASRGIGRAIAVELAKTAQRDWDVPRPPQTRRIATRWRPVRDFPVQPGAPRGPRGADRLRAGALSRASTCW